MKIRLISGYMNTRLNNEDFALSPYIFIVYHKGGKLKVFGIGLCWGFHSIHISLGVNLPKEYPTFKVHNKNN